MKRGGLNEHMLFKTNMYAAAGMVDGFDGFPERDLLAKLTQGAVTFLDPNNRAADLTCEGMYTRSGFMTPGAQFWIHSDFDRQKGKDGRIGGYVNFTNPPDHGMRREDRLVPKYGYVAMPKKEDAMSFGYRKHHPTASENVHVATSMKFRYRYVTTEHLLNYLAAMKTPVLNAVFGKDHRVDFNTWLSQGCHAKEFHIAPGFTVKALLRDVVDVRLLDQHHVNFADGDFSGVDFSYSTFRNVTIANMQRARLIGCNFVGCTATGSAISGSDLSLSTIDQCKFEGLNGALTLNFGVLSASSFAGCSFIVSSFSGSAFCGAGLFDLPSPIFFLLLFLCRHGVRPLNAAVLQHQLR
jgi:hypothetical protein